MSLFDLALTKGQGNVFDIETIQRIEKGESNPTGESLKRLSNALNVSPDDLIDWSIKEDKKYLIYLNLSALTFLVFPLLGILIPFILWSSKNEKIKDINKLGKDLINFEITWTLVLFFIPILMLVVSKFLASVLISISVMLIVIGSLYFMNFIFILINTIRISNNKDAMYLPKIKFLK